MIKPEPMTAAEVVWPKKFWTVTSVVMPTTCSQACSYSCASGFPLLTSVLETFLVLPESLPSTTEGRFSCASSSAAMR